MAERLKAKLLEESPGGVVDLVAGPDAYRQLPNLVESLSPMPRPSLLSSSGEGEGGGGVDDSTCIKIN
jgi:hypothetical protein